ncbi:MAG: polysaccharide deacetylase family protein [Ignavibacteria bacterium]|nr:polysaccharide deacetylase family protein [Ignavibacteria bacterium]
MILKTTNIHSKLFPSFIWKGDEKNIYLTFDDGPHPEATQSVIKVLDKEKIKATFFLIGKNIIKYPNLVSTLVSEGHTIANHSYFHNRTTSFSLSKLKNELKNTDDLLLAHSKSRVKLYRPPYGFFTWNTKNVATQLNYKVCMWTLLSGDFYGWEKDKIINHTIKNITNGSIIVFHDNEKTKNVISQTLQEIIPRLGDMGYKFSTLK